MPLLLNIDTATENASVSLTNNGIVLAFAESTEQKNHASFVQIAIEKIIADTQITFNQIITLHFLNNFVSFFLFLIQKSELGPCILHSYILFPFISL